MIAPVSTLDRPLMLQTLLRLPLLGRLAPQAGMVPAEGIPMLKSVEVLTLGCQSTIDNDVPFSLKCVLFI